MSGYVKTGRELVLAGCLAALLAGCGSPDTEPVGAADTVASTNDADIIVVGAGLAGLSAAIDAASGGARVLVIDMNSVFGGHGIQSGGVAFINSTMQEELGYEDDPAVAYADWMEWTVDGHAQWNRFYVENSREMLWDWLTGLGVRFDRIRPSHGNSVPRFHMTHRRGLNLTRPIFLEALRYSNIDFRWNAVADHLTKDGDRVVGVEGLDYRTGSRFALRGETVILATGGFQSNIDMVRANWRDDLPAPGPVYSMSGQNSRGSGHRMAEEAGAALVNLDRQYNGYTIVPDMFGLDEARGYYGGNARSIWVNSAGERFVTELGIDRYVFDAVMRQQPEGHWSIYDFDDKDGFRLNGPHFVSADAVDHEKIQRLAVENPDITQKADTLAELAALIGVPPDSLEATVAHYNALVANGESTDVDGLPPEDTPPVFTIDTPPYYATKLYPMANKSAGGVSIDMRTHALDASGTPVPGLYAAGEITGSAGMNGLNGLDGMFTGPSILTGRVAGRTAAAELAEIAGWEPVEFTRRGADWDMTRPADSSWTPALGPADVQNMLADSRDGYWHFERVHNLVLERGYGCTNCHSERVPFYTALSREDKAMQTQICETCHLAPAGTLPGADVQRTPARVSN
ncbi:MAG: FAD-dependent oxidoreductase [Gammaproteobacteria bacterium]|nr:FAD-dependent oxidoreductase [Gammaproteobacteria bacterium]MDH3505760.1 FAD-dependent oxidoreductase [Gammaproteobacteria bacterium]